MLQLGRDTMQAGSQSTMMLDIQRMCIAELAREYFNPEKQQIIASGDVYLADEDYKCLEAFTDTMKAHSAGGMAENANFTVFVIPVGQQAWDFLQIKRADAGVQLQYVITSPLAIASSNTNTIRASPERNEEISKSTPLDLGLDAKTLFSGASERNAFLMFHPEYRSEIDMLIAGLYDLDTTVYLLSDPGAWTYFRSKKYGAVIVHPSFDDFHLIPELSSILQNSHMKFFSFDAVTTQTSTAPHLQPLPTLFSHGRAVLIMDILWKEHADEIGGLIRSIESRIKKNGDANCLLGRPDLVAWLEKLAYDELENPDATDDTKKAQQHLFVKVHAMLHAKREYRGMWPDAETPTETSPIFFEPESCLPGYNDAAETNAHQAEEILVDWFATWTLRNIRKYRNFIVVSPYQSSSKQKRAWSDKYKHVEFVTPLKYMEAVRRKEEYEAERLRRFEEQKRLRDRAKVQKEESSEMGSNSGA